MEPPEVAVIVSATRRASFAVPDTGPRIGALALAKATREDLRQSGRRCESLPRRRCLTRWPAGRLADRGQCERTTGLALGLLVGSYQRLRRTIDLTDGSATEAPNLSSCLTLVWAVLDLYLTHAKNGVRFSQLERQRLRRMRHTGSDQTTDEEVSAA